jgi:membrane associated rhomboid family serine protease
VVALLWAVEIVDFFLGGALDGLGVLPGDTSWPWGLAFAPFLHGGFDHLIANTTGLIPLGLMTMVRKRKDFWVVTVVSALTAGAGAWLFGGASEVHIGASGVIFGYFGFLLGRGWYDRRMGPLMMSFVTFWLYGGMVWGVFPSDMPVSWQSHLFGFLGGLLVARQLGQALRARV